MTGSLGRPGPGRLRETATYEEWQIDPKNRDECAD
jgi:hypothetical protein